MTRCTELEIQAMLPDLLHRSIDASGLSRIESHVAACDSCAEDLRILRMVAGAAVFAPAIDTDRVVRQIVPYKMPLPTAPARVRSRVVSWLVAASMLIVLAGGGSLLLAPRSPVARIARGPAAEQGPPVGSTKVPVATSPSDYRATTVASAEPSADAVAIAAGVDGLSDGDLRQLMDEMNGFDALPATEAEPVISVDGIDLLDQGE
jgi:hypothetical protein